MSDTTLALVQQQILQKGAQWDAGQTTISRLARSARSRRLGLALGPQALQKRASRFRIESSLTKPSFPPVFNWKNYNGVDLTNPVKDQGDCGSCVAFACNAVFECQLAIDTNRRQALSEAFLFFCGGGNCSDGWDIEPALGFMQNTGVTDEACLPYSTAGSPRPCARRCLDWKTRVSNIASYREIATPDWAKYWISQRGPLVAAMDVYDDFRFYLGGIYSHVYGENIGQHAIALIGYDDSESFWICKNSWGNGWGESGYFAIRFGECNICVQYPLWGIDGTYVPVRKGIYPGRSYYAERR